MTAGDSSCEGRQWQAKAAAATATATAGDSSCDGGGQQAKAASKTGDGIFLDGGGWPLQRRATAALTARVQILSRQGMGGGEQDDREQN